MDYNVKGRRMVFEEDIQKIGEVKAALLEDIVDKDGHERFIEGSAVGNTITGVTYDYAKWSLSGTHLMVVLSLTVAANTSLGTTTVIGKLNDLPDWILSKIFSISGSDIVVRKNFMYDWYNTSGIGIGQNYLVALYKNNGQIEIKPMAASISSTGDYQIRIQFDLLIDNE